MFLDYWLPLNRCLMVFNLIGTQWSKLTYVRMMKREKWNIQEKNEDLAIL